MRPHLAVFRARFLALLQYRAAALAGLATQVFWGFIRVMVFVAFYRAAGAAARIPMPLQDAITYVWLGQATLMFLPWRPEPEAAELVRSGNVAYEFLRPLDTYALWFTRSAAFRTAPTLLRALPMFALAVPFLGMGLPASPACFLLWLVSTAAAALLSAAITCFVTVTLLWTISGQGIAMLVNASVWILSGIALPIAFFPDALQPLLRALPFRGLMDTPFTIWLGHLDAAGVAAAIGHQIAWTAAIVLLGRFCLARGRRRLVVQGG